MKSLYIERSTGECRNGNWVEALDLDGVDRIIVGTGPGSFAGIRSAIAFAQGYAMGKHGVEVLGLPSPCAVIGDDDRSIAVVGDARQGKMWIALFERGRLSREVFQEDAEKIPSHIPDGYSVVSSDDRRIGERLRAMFGERYLGEAMPSAQGLEAYAVKCPSELKPEPLPIYLNPAVRT